MTARSVVIVGASLAGTRAAEELRRQGFDGHLSLVGREAHFPPFDRPPLSKEVLSGAWELEQSRLQLYENIDAEILLGRSATGLDMYRQELELDDGSSLSFDALIIATGAAVRLLPIPGAGLSGVCYYRTAEDCRQVLDAFAKRPRVTIIGAGFIGSEVAAVCRERNLAVTIIDVSPRPLSEVFGDRVSEFLVRRHVEHGTTLKLGVGVSAITGDGRVEHVVCNDGSSVPTDLLVIGVGVVPDTNWLSGSDLVLSNGIVCDAHLRVIGTPHIFAAGDVARWFNPLYHQHMRVEHWTNAVEQAEHAARVLIHGKESQPALAAIPYFWSDQYGSRLQFVGIKGPQERLAAGSLEEGKFVVTYGRMGRMVGAFCLNWPSNLPKYRRDILDRAPWNSV